MATIAAIAAGVAVAGAAANTGMQASGGKKGAGAPPARPTAPIWENIFNRDTADVLGNERAMYDNAMASSNFMDDYMYRALGYEPQYDQAQDADIAAKSQAFNTVNEQLNAAQQRFADIKAQKPYYDKATKKQKQAAKAAGRISESKKKQMVKTTKKEIERLERQVEATRQALSQAQTVPRRIVGMTPIQPQVGGPGTDVRGVPQLAALPDPTSSKDGLYAAALDLELNNLVRALKGEEPADPTLVRTLDEEDRQLEEALRRNLGPDYATSTPGIEALANQSKRRAEALATYNREAIATYSNLTTERAASLSSLRGQRIDQEMAPLRAQLAQILAANEVAAGRIDYLRERRAERADVSDFRLQRYNAELNAAQQAAERRKNTGQSIQNLTGSISSGLMGAGGFGG